MSTPLVIVLASALALPPGRFEAGGVRIDVAIQAHLYTWTVTNLDAPPITSFEMNQYSSTEQEAPDGWTTDVDPPRFRAWTEDMRYAIPQGQSKVFEARFKSTGAVVGLVPVQVGFQGTDEMVTVEGVWSPTPKRASMVVLVAVVVAGLAVAHTVILERRGRRHAARPPGG